MNYRTLCKHNFYKDNHINQTLNFVLQSKKNIIDNINYVISFDDAIKMLNEVIDDSDPDTTNPQTTHMFQTAHAAKKMYPDKDWFHLVGFIHDLGKILAHPLMYNLPQWATVGDTFPVGCAFNDNVIYSSFFVDNPDNNNDKLNTTYGIYTENIGFNNVHFSFGHDEYMYQVCIKNKCTIPEEGLYLIRFHSFYAWHEHNAYSHLADDYDKYMLPMLQDFQKCDLYSKHDDSIPCDINYYNMLLCKYFPSEKILW